MAVTFSDEFKQHLIGHLAKEKYFVAGEDGTACLRFNAIQLSNDEKGRGLAVCHMLDGEAIYTYYLPGVRLSPPFSLNIPTPNARMPFDLTPT